MQLAELFEDLQGVPNVRVSGVQLDSRAVEPGDLFLAMKGLRFDGHGFIDAAIACGAVAVAAEQPVANCTVPLVVAQDLGQRASRIASRVYGEPSKVLDCICVTGTNGKTSVAHFTSQLAHLLDVSAGFLGTTGWGLADRPLQPAELTTVDAVTLQKRLQEVLHAGATLAALEVSSHALQQHRVSGLTAKVAIFTNLSRDHLDYHNDMDSYASAKARLFELPGLPYALINVDDSYGRELAQRCAKKTNLRTLTYGHRAIDNIEAALIESVRATPTGLTWRLRCPWGDVSLTAGVCGLHNAANISAALLSLAGLGYDIELLAQAVAGLEAPAGRLQRVTSQGVTQAVIEEEQVQVFVDYAHTPDALATMLQALRPHAAGRLLCVFGCGGDRDRGKRAPMGQAVVDHADLGWVTTDNPRSEDPQEIIRDVLLQLADDKKLTQEVDRRTAIGAAIKAAKPGDLVVIAGKGHENYQEINGERHPFDDVAVAREWLEVLN